MYYLSHKGFVVLCWSKHSLLSPSKQGPCQLQVSSSFCSSTVVFRVMRVNQIDFYISIVLAVSIFLFCCSWRSDFRHANPNTHGSYPESEWCDCVCERACLYRSLYELSLYCLCRLSQQLYDDEGQIFCCFWNPFSLNTLSCWLQLDWWALQNYKSTFFLIGMLFLFEYNAEFVIAVDKDHNKQCRMIGKSLAKIK